MKLNRDAILDEAIALLDEAGLAEVSLRKLAARLDARAPSLARHVGDKANLTALMSHRIFCSALDEVPAGLYGDDWLHAYGLALWRKQQSTRDIGGLLGTTPAVPELDEDIRSRIAARMEAAGLKGDQANVVQSSIQALVTGWNTFARSKKVASAGSNIDFEAAFRASLTALIHGFAEVDQA